MNSHHVLHNRRGDTPLSVRKVAVIGNPCRQCAMVAHSRIAGASDASLIPECRRASMASDRSQVAAAFSRGAASIRAAKSLWKPGVTQPRLWCSAPLKASHLSAAPAMQLVVVGNAPCLPNIDKPQSGIRHFRDNLVIWRPSPCKRQARIIKRRKYLIGLYDPRLYQSGDDNENHHQVQWHGTAN